MKTPEDEAFDDLAKKQGAWGGGFTAKRKMAAEKLLEEATRSCNNIDEQRALNALMRDAQPAQEPEREALKLALEALDIAQGMLADLRSQHQPKMLNAYTAIKEALAQPAQEPVALHEAVISAWSLREVYFDEEGIPSMHRSPPQREWVGLTDEEIAQGNKESWVDRQAFESAVWWAEAKLKEKNG